MACRSFATCHIFFITKCRLQQFEKFIWFNNLYFVSLSDTNRNL